MSGLDLTSIREEFPIFRHNPDLVYLDNSATTQKPRCVLDRLEHFYEWENANARRGVYGLSETATVRYEKARAAIARQLGAEFPEEVVFVRGATEAINLVARSWGGRFLSAGDEILISAMEHHSNIVPWQQIALERGAKIRICGLTQPGDLDLDDFEKKLSGSTKIVALTHASNVLGTINPVRKIVAMAHRFGAKILIDGAQFIAHRPINFRDLGCDFYVFSGHKVFAPMGIGVLVGRREILDQMPPYQTGGGMIERVERDHSTFRGLPEKFDAGTPPIAGAIALQTALEFLGTIDGEAAQEREDEVRHFLEEELACLPSVQYIGRSRSKVGVFSIASTTVHSHDLASFLASKNIAVRAGHHCAQLLLPVFRIQHSLRASFAIYNGMDDAKKFMAALREGLKLFS